MSSKASRRRAREFALQGIYQWLLSGNSLTGIEEHIAQSTGYDKADHELLTTLLRGTLANAPDLENEFAAYIHRAVHELSPVERAILLLGTFELKHSIETPYRVIINEAIELAKSFGGTDGHRFVNGVLDKLAGQLRKTEIAVDRSESQD